MEAGAGSENNGGVGSNSSGKSDIPSIDPIEIDAAIANAGSVASGGDNASGPGEKRRGRPPGSGNKGPRQASGTGKAASKAPLDVNAIQFALTGIHALLAAGLSAPELTLSDAEAEIVSKNIVAVARHYDLQATAKATDWGNLIVSLGVVYGGRFVSLTARKRQENAMRRQQRANPPPPPPRHQSPVASVTNPTPTYHQPDLPDEVAPGVRNDAPKTVTVHHPNAAGPPTGAMPKTRAPSKEEQQTMLEEFENYVG